MNEFKKLKWAARGFKLALFIFFIALGPGVGATLVATQRGPVVIIGAIALGVVGTALFLGLWLTRERLAALDFLDAALEDPVWRRGHQALAIIWVWVVVFGIIIDGERLGSGLFVMGMVISGALIWWRRWSLWLVGGAIAVFVLWQTAITGQQAGTTYPYWQIAAWMPILWSLWAWLFGGPFRRRGRLSTLR